MGMAEDLTPEEIQEVKSEMQDYICLNCRTDFSAYFGRLCDNRKGWVGNKVCPFCKSDKVLIKYHPNFKKVTVDDGVKFKFNCPMHSSTLTCLLTGESYLRRDN